MFRQLTYYNDSSQTGGRGQKTTKTFLCNLNNVETIISYSDHSKITMNSGQCFWVNELEDCIIPKSCRILAEMA